jgi:uncharacterized protein YhdP
VRGGIGVNVPAPQPDSGLVVNVNVRSLDLDAWSATMSGLSGISGASAAARPPKIPHQQCTRAGHLTSRHAAPNAAQNAPPNAAKPAPNAALAQYIDTDVLAVRAGELIVGNKKLDNVVVGASHADGNWQANIASTQVSGYVSWRESRSGRGRGRVTARLASLIVPPSAASDVSDLLEGRGAATQIPALDIVADNFELFGKKLGRLELNANNASTPNGREWRINRLSVVQPGRQHVGHRQIRQQRWPSANLAELQARYRRTPASCSIAWALPMCLRGGRGRMSGDVNWKGLPFSLDIPSLNGQLEMDLALPASS